MKYLVMLIVAVVFVWHWRSNRRAELEALRRKVHPSPKAPAGPVDMVQCARCNLHLPLSDTVAGRDGRYCSTEHRALAER